MAVAAIDPQENWIIDKRGCAVWVVRGLLVVAVLLVLLGVTRERWLNAVARFLVSGEAPRPAAAILVLSGGPGDRARHGAQLFAEGYAPVVLTAGEPHIPGTPAFDAQYEMGRLELFGIPAENIQTLGVLSSTIQEAERSRDWMEANGKRALTVVSDPYHMRRVSIIFETVFRSAEIELIYVATEPSWFRPEGWWKRDADFDAVVSEYVKMANTLAELASR